MGGCFHTKCRSTNRLDGKTAIVTGCNSGIGKSTVQDFFKRGARVIMACRSMEKAEKSAMDIRQNALTVQKYLLGQIVIVHLDLADLASVRACANKILEQESRIDLLINNAGIMLCPESQTADGFEMQFGTNHLGHFLFTLLLLPKIIKSRPARIITISSRVHAALKGPLRFDDLNWKKRRYNSLQAYDQSKLANILFTKELARRLEDANIIGVTTYSLHPGLIQTELFRHFDHTVFRGACLLFNTLGPIFLKSPEQGAQTTIYCAVDDMAGYETGLYYVECKVKDSSNKSKNIKYAERLWEISLKMVGLDEDYNPFFTQ